MAHWRQLRQKQKKNRENTAERFTFLLSLYCHSETGVWVSVKYFSLKNGRTDENVRKALAPIYRGSYEHNEQTAT